MRIFPRLRLTERITLPGGNLFDLAVSESVADTFSEPEPWCAVEPGESEKDFRVRLQQAAREERDRIAEALKHKYAPKLAAIAERIRRSESAEQQQKSQHTQAVLQTAVAVSSGLLSAFLGRKALSATTVSRAATAARQMGRTWKESEDVGRAGGKR